MSPNRASVLPRYPLNAAKCYRKAYNERSLRPDMNGNPQIAN
jgi:hypothetical protein